MKIIKSIIFNYLLDRSFYSEKHFLFIFLFRIRTFLQKRDISISILKHKVPYLYKLTELNTERFFFNKRQGYLSYHNGIQSRIKELKSVYFLDKIKFSKNDLVIDIGANIGDFNLCFTDQNIKYIGFEPGKQEFKCLKKNLVSGNCKIYNIALSDKTGKIDFYYKPDNGDSSIIKQRNYVKKYTVNTTTLDFFLNKEKINKVKLLKLEAEGAETEIINGSLNILDKIEFISADLGFERGLLEESTAPNVINMLLNNGFNLVEISKTKRKTFLFKNIKF